jgi:hypothetical protein
MSGRIYFAIGEQVYYHRKGSVDLVTITARRDTPGGFGDQQYLTSGARDPDDWTHESWFCFTAGEAEARRVRWEQQSALGIEELDAALARGEDARHQDGGMG